MAFYLARIAEINPQHTALVSLESEESLFASADAADQRLKSGHHDGWMHGFPHAFKDLANVAGLITSFGSPLFAEHIATADDLFVARIRDQGAIAIGKTNVPEFGLGSQSYNSLFGTSRNAFDKNLTAGGSSGGAAAALALGLVPVADGSDMMGSLRNPAAFNNVVSLRPGLGRVPSIREDQYFNQLVTDGPMARTMEDLIYLFTTMAGFHPSAPLSQQAPLPIPTDFCALKSKHVKIGWFGNFDGYLKMESGVLDVCEKALANLADANVSVEHVKSDFSMSSLWDAWLTLRHWQIGSTRKALFDDPLKRQQLKPELIWEITQSERISGADVAAASGCRTAWYQYLQNLFVDYDFLALPAAQVFPFPADIHWPNEIAGVTMDSYHRWMEVVIGASMAAVPALALPAGFDNRRAMGIQLLGPMGADQTLLEFGLTYEAVNPWAMHYQFETISGE